MTNHSLSYIISTKNRFTYLKILFERLLPHLEPGEEIVVVDSNSSDGSKEYLQELYSSGKIHQFISEADKNQAHGWNKALLMANGTIIKKLIDDDVPDFKAIRTCRDFMLRNPEIDICISDMMTADVLNPAQVGLSGRLSYFKEWKAGHNKTFTFSDVSMLQRRSSLSFIGLYDTQFKMLDWEYSLRATHLGAKIAYYTGYNALAVDTPGNVTSTATPELKKLEESIGRVKYEYAGDESDISLYSKIKVWIGETRDELKKSVAKGPLPQLSETQLREIYASYYRKLEEKNAAAKGQFIF